MQGYNLQLWSANAMLSENLDKGLELVKSLGVSGVELYSLYNLKKEELKAKLDSFGFKTVSAHVGLKRLRENLMYELECLNYLGCRELVCPYAEINSVESAKKFADEFNEVGRICAQNGFGFSYHNHANEFQFDRGMYPLDILFENTEPQYVKAQLDVYWIDYAGVDPYRYVEKYKGRMNSIHLKQGDSKKNNVDAQDGIIDFQRIMDIVPGVIPVYEQEFEKGIDTAFIKKCLEHSSQYLNEFYKQF